MIKKTSVFNLRDAFFAVMGVWLIIFLDDCKLSVLISISTIGNPSDGLIGLDVEQLIIKIKDLYISKNKPVYQLNNVGWLWVGVMAAIEK